MKYKQTETYLQKIDIFLSGFHRFFLCVFFLSLLYYFVLFPQTGTVFNEYVPISVWFAIYTLWFYRSSRKYGLVDTTIFSIFVPFFLIGAIIPLLSTPKEKSVVKIDLSSLMDSFADALTTSVNDVYSGNVIEKDSKTDGVYITIEVPYGIHIPKQELIDTVAPDIHISASHIIWTDITDRRTQFIITSKGLQDYGEYKKLCMPYDTLSEIVDRIALRMNVPPVSQKKRSVSL